MESASCIETQLLINANMLLDKLNLVFINDNPLSFYQIISHYFENISL